MSEGKAYEQAFDLGTIAALEKDIDAARATEQRATDLMVSSARNPTERAEWTRLAEQEQAAYEQKKEGLARARAEAMGQADASEEEMAAK